MPMKGAEARRLGMTQTQDALSKLAAAAAMLGAAVAVRGQSWNSYYVDSRAPAGGDGLSWATAFRDLQPALDHAMSEYGPPDIYVAGGTYHPDAGTGDRTRSYTAVTSSSSLNIIGSCAGLGAADPFVVSIDEHPTILSGDLAGDDEPGFINTGENSRNLLLLEGPGEYTHVTISNVVFTAAVGAEGESDAGALRTNGVESLVVDGCRFVANRGERGGAIEGDTPEIDRSLFARNHAFDSGGALYAQFASIFQSEFRENSAQNDGGAAWIGYGTVDQSRFLQNSARRGGAMFVGDNTTIAASSLFARNSASLTGGALYVSAAYSYFYNLTMAENSSSGSSCIWSNSQLMIRNCILAGDQPLLEGPRLPSIAFSAVEGGTAGFGIISAPPRFVDASAGNYRLDPFSPCIDSGSNDSPWGSGDADGNWRRRDDPGTPDTGLGFAPIVDIGAYEFHGTTCYADCDASGGLNVLDFNCFLTSFTAGSPRANCDNSSTPPTLNVLDFTCFINHYTAGCP
jgi:predicted outer membrane repeat protein